MINSNSVWYQRKRYNPKHTHLHSTELVGTGTLTTSNMSYPYQPNTNTYMYQQTNTNTYQSTNTYTYQPTNTYTYQPTKYPLANTYNSTYQQTSAHTCRNCGRVGHLYKDCKYPIMSFGIICFRETNEPTNSKVEYIMIQRKDSLCFMEFVRGKYDPYNLSYLQSLFNNMTADERASIMSKSFDELWNQVWFQPAPVRSSHNSEYAESRRKYEIISGLGMHDMLRGTPTYYSEPEWGFPKGRRRMKERDVDCAVREFCEETGFRPNDIKLADCPPFEECFFGTNNVKYRHVYFIASMQTVCDQPILVDQSNIHQVREVRKIEFFPFEVAYNLIRSHNQERKALFTDVNAFVKHYFVRRPIYSINKERQITILKRGEELNDLLDKKDSLTDKLSHLNLFVERYTHKK